MNHFGNDFTIVGDDMTLKNQRAGVDGCHRREDTVCSDPAFLEAFDLIRAGLGIGGCACGKDAKILGIVIAKGDPCSRTGPDRNAHADIAQVDVVGWGRVRELCHYVVFVGKSLPTDQPRPIHERASLRAMRRRRMAG